MILDLKQLKLFRTVEKVSLNINSILNAFKWFHKVIFILTSVNKRATNHLIFNLDGVNLG
jgi:hypothetical protein